MTKLLAQSTSKVSSSPAPVYYGMFIDTMKCTGCRICVVACKLEKGLPVDEKPSKLETQPIIPKITPNNWSIVKPVPTDMGTVFLKLQCMQCEEPSCASVCPTKAALIKESKGKAYTTIDITKCFGCKYCNLVCPFNVPQFDPKGKTAIKCTFCDERLDQGLRPACFEACPTGAIKFGVREKIRKLAIERAKEINGYVYGLNEAGGTNILLILPMQPRELGLPEIDKEPYDSISVLKRILVEKTGIPKFILALITFISLIILTLVI